MNTIHWRVQLYRNGSPITKRNLLYAFRNKCFAETKSAVNLKASELESLYTLIVNNQIKSIEDILSLGMEAQSLKRLGLTEQTFTQIVDAVWKNKSRIDKAESIIARNRLLNEIITPLTTN